MENHIKNATQIVEELKANPNTKAVTTDAKTEALVLKHQRGALLEELAALEDKHLLALMNVLCSNFVEANRICDLQQTLSEEIKALQLNQTGWVVSFVKVCNSRLKGNTSGVRL